MARTVKMFTKTIEGDGLFFHCQSPQEMFDALEEIRQDIKDMLADGVEMLTPSRDGHCQFVTTDKRVAVKHCMYGELEFELADQDEPDPIAWTPTNRLSRYSDGAGEMP